MMRLLFGCILAAAGVMAAAGTQDDAAIRVPLENYMKGHATGNGDFMRKAFHPDARMTYVNEGKLQIVPITDFIARFTGKPAADEALRKRYIENITASNDSAVATLVLDYPDVRFVDYMTLLKINGEWKIINKSFHKEPKL